MLGQYQTDIDDIIIKTVLDFKACRKKCTRFWTDSQSMDEWTTRS